MLRFSPNAAEEKGLALVRGNRASCRMLSNAGSQVMLQSSRAVLPVNLAVRQDVMALGSRISFTARPNHAKRVCTDIRLSFLDYRCLASMPTPSSALPESPFPLCVLATHVVHSCLPINYIEDEKLSMFNGLGPGYGLVNRPFRYPGYCRHPTLSAVGCPTPMVGMIRITS